MKFLIAILISFIPKNILAVETSISSVTSGCQDGNCGFADLFALANALLGWAIVGTTSAATIMFVYAGFLYVTAQGDPNQIKRAHNVFKIVAIGFVIVLAAFLLIKELLTKLGLSNGLGNLLSFSW